MLQRPGYQSLRKGRRSVIGGVYHVTAVTRDRADTFADPRIARQACRSLHAHGASGELRVLCWTLMPDHLHLLVELRTHSLSRAVGRLKAVISNDLRLAGGPARGVWSAGFHDRAMRREQDLQAVARYIIANPIRAGLARSFGDYPYWNAVWL